MKHLPLCPSRQRVAVLAAACALVLLAAPAAYAFTMEGQDNGSSSNDSAAARRLTDPEGQSSRFGTEGGTTIRQGNTTMKFGGQAESFGQRYNTDRMFNPLGRPGEDR